MARTQHRPLQNPNIQGMLVLGMVFIISTLLIWNNQQPEQQISPPAIVPTATSYSGNWQIPMQEQLSSLPGATPLPDDHTPFVAPTLPPTEATVESIRPNEVPGASSPTPLEIVENSLDNAPSPTPIFANASTPIPVPTQFNVDPAVLPQVNEQYQLPPEQVPLSLGPNDHFLLDRPVNIAANSESLYYYPYGSGGQQGWRIHRGLDMPNPVGKPVQATGAGTVVWACSADCEYSEGDLGDLEIYESYGNFVVIEHDIGWRGQRIWTLYAHLSAVVVEEGQRVEARDTIGLVGISGQVTGPHVHFEVRVGTNSYSDTRNPLLWMAPYINHGVVAGSVRDGNGDFIADNFASGATAMDFVGRISDVDWSLSDAGLQGFNTQTAALYVEQVDEQSDGRVGLKQLPNVFAEFDPENNALLSDHVDDSFNAMRRRTLDMVGYDILGNLESTFWSMNRVPEAGQEPFNWHYAGRAIALDRNLIFTQQPLVVVREDTEFGTAWRIFAPVAEDAQDGLLGEPLRDIPWDFAGREEDPIISQEGGRLMQGVPSGYYVDLTRLFSDFGWERILADRTWRTNFSGILYWEFEKRDNLEWQSAMLQIYPQPEVLAFLQGETPRPSTPIPTVAPLPEDVDAEGTEPAG